MSGPSQELAELDQHDHREAHNLAHPDHRRQHQPRRHLTSTRCRRARRGGGSGVVGGVYLTPGNRSGVLSEHTKEKERGGEERAADIEEGVTQPLVIAQEYFSKRT